MKVSIGMDTTAEQSLTCSLEAPSRFLAIKALTGASEVLKSGVFTPLLQEARLCSGQDIGRLIGT